MKMIRAQAMVPVIVLSALLVGCTAARTNNVDDQRYASLRYTYPYQPNQSQDKEYEHPGNPLKHHYYD